MELTKYFSTPSISVIVYGGDPLTRAGVAAHLGHQPDIALRPARDRPVESSTREGEADAGEVALMLDDQLDPKSITTLRKLGLDHGKRVILVVSELEERHLSMVIEAGVSSVVWRHQATPARLVKAIRATARNEGDMPGDLLRRILAHLERQAQGTVLSTIASGSPTSKELNVLELVAHGLGTKEIAEKLSYSERTIKGILHDAMTRLHLRNRAHAVAYAIREGYM
ncbi:LuxR C-terminal-related transcriptional regulator [Streptomyces sp. NPDC088747]|uniref:response regulator transcription factor n=1 Tax=Streptomyces sp. NPDC088747 TaxID=3365886 RepID=UPI0038134D1E